jgi:hypothetical protein
MCRTWQSGELASGTVPAKEDGMCLMIIGIGGDFTACWQIFSFVRSQANSVEIVGWQCGVASKPRFDKSIVCCT